jgi:plastocyanin
MRRTLGALGVLVLACAISFAAPAGSGASSSATTSAKSKCKHKHHRAKQHRHHRKRCHKKRPPVDGTTTGTVDGSVGTGGDAPTGPPGRLLATEREVSATELQLQLSRPSLAAGSAIVEQYNAGSDPHNLILERNGVFTFSFETLDPGGDARQTLNLTHGTWTLYCSLLDHRDLGMQATLTVN